ncbi:MAG: hypothetical protein R2710_01740 [Acidimicrobiales bacterium]
MTPRHAASIIDRLRRAGTALPTSPDIEAIIARAAQRKRRRQIGVTAASVVVVGGLGFSSAQLLRGPATTSIDAAGPTVDVVTTTTAPVEPPVENRAASMYEPGNDDWRPASTTTTVLTTTIDAGVTQSVQAARRSELADGLGGAIVVEEGRLTHRAVDGSMTTLELPEALPTTERRVTDVAPLGDHPFLLVSDFTDRPDLAEAGGDNTRSDPVHQEVAIYAVDLTTNEVHVVEQRTITDKQSPDWVFNGLVTAQNGHIMVVRELWQSMCVYVETLALDGTPMETPENPLPEPSLAGLDGDDIHAMQAGLVEPPRGCIAADELPDGAMSVLGSQADPAALESVNNQLRTAASTAAEALGS